MCSLIEYEKTLHSGLWTLIMKLKMMIFENHKLQLLIGWDNF